MSAQLLPSTLTLTERLDEIAADEGSQANCMFQLSIMLARISLEPFSEDYKEATEQVLLGLIRNKPRHNVVHLFDPSTTRKPLISLVRNQGA